MLRAALALTGVLAAVAPAAAAPRVRILVAGQGSSARLGPRAVSAAAATVSASGKRCGVAAATPLAALLATRLPLQVRDYGGACSRRASDGGALFVVGIGSERNRGRDGWVYKVGARSGTAGAADPAGPFGRGRLRSGAHVTWFWCRMGAAGTCQRTLGVSARRTVARGRQLRVRVRGYDDFGHGVAVAGARVQLGGLAAITGRDGVAYVRTPDHAGHLRLGATRSGMVRAFGRGVRVT